MALPEPQPLILFSFDVTMNRFNKSAPIKQRYKILTYVAAWMLAFFGTDPSGRLWALAWMFPLGLAASVHSQWSAGGGWGIFFVCIGVYVVHGYFYFRSKNLRPTVLLYGVLVILLVCNVEGCRQMLGRTKHPGDSS